MSPRDNIYNQLCRRNCLRNRRKKWRKTGGKIIKSDV